jgi:hypothetical protein
MYLVDLVSGEMLMLDFSRITCGASTLAHSACPRANWWAGATWAPPASHPHLVPNGTHTHTLKLKPIPPTSWETPRPFSASQTTFLAFLDPILLPLRSWAGDQIRFDVGPSLTVGQLVCERVWGCFVKASHITHKTRAVNVKLWEPKWKCPKAVPTHLQRHVVWSQSLKCHVDFVLFHNVTQHTKSLLSRVHDINAKTP